MVRAEQSAVQKGHVLHVLPKPCVKPNAKTFLVLATAAHENPVAT